MGLNPWRFESSRPHQFFEKLFRSQLPVVNSEFHCPNINLHCDTLRVRGLPVFVIWQQLRSVEDVEKVSDVLHVELDGPIAARRGATLYFSKSSLSAK